MSKEELTALIDAELNSNVSPEKSRDKATGKKGYAVMSKNLGDSIWTYLETIYLPRILREFANRTWYTDYESELTDAVSLTTDEADGGSGVGRHSHSISAHDHGVPQHRHSFTINVSGSSGAGQGSGGGRGAQQGGQQGQGAGSGGQGSGGSSGGQGSGGQGSGGSSGDGTLPNGQPDNRTPAERQAEIWSLTWPYTYIKYTSNISLPVSTDGDYIHQVGSATAGTSISVQANAYEYYPQSLSEINAKLSLSGYTAGLPESQYYAGGDVNTKFKWNIDGPRDALNYTTPATVESTSTEVIYTFKNMFGNDLVQYGDYRLRLAKPVYKVTQYSVDYGGTIGPYAQQKFEESDDGNINNGSAIIEFMPNWRGNNALIAASMIRTNRYMNGQSVSIRDPHNNRGVINGGAFESPSGAYVIDIKNTGEVFHG